MKANELIGRTFYYTNWYIKNLTFKVISSAGNDEYGDYVNIESWTSRAGDTKRPIGRVKMAMAVRIIEESISKGTLSPKKLK